MHTKEISELADMLNTKQCSAVELTEYFINRINKYDNKLNCFITVDPEYSLAQARLADDKIRKNKASFLTGIPVGMKDIFCTKGIKTSCGSKMLDNFIAPYDATIITKLLEQGAIILGKTNMDEFAMGSSTENSYYGVCCNPWDITTVPGGSSGGSAAAIAARLVPCATGSDTGGSIRQPAAFCGVTGIKPTYGLVSRFGMIAFASSLDQAGPMGQSAKDCALLLKAMAGFDPKDSTSSDKKLPDFQKLSLDVRNLTIGMPKEFFNPGLDPEIQNIVHNVADTYKRLGANLKEISLPTCDLAIPAYYVIAPAECSSNLSRYDGVRFGYRCKHPYNLDDLYKRSRSEGFGKEVKRRILIGTYMLSAGYYDAYYLKAQKIRQMIADDYIKAFQTVDIILAPTTPSTAFKIGEKLLDPVSMYLSDIYTSGINLAGLPALSMPAGFSNGMPVGVQLIGNYFAEHLLLSAADEYQKQTDWHKRIPTEFN